MSLPFQIFFQHCLFSQDGSTDFDVEANVDIHAQEADILSVRETWSGAAKKLTRDEQERIERVAVDVALECWGEENAR
jgi:hypothetical protein